MEPILTQDELLRWTGWAMIGMAVLQAVEVWSARGTAQFWKELRAAMLFVCVGAGVTLRQDALTGWMLFPVACATVMIGRDDPDLATQLENRKS